MGITSETNQGVAPKSESAGVSKVAYVLLIFEVILQFVVAGEEETLKNPKHYDYIRTESELESLIENRILIGGCLAFIAGALSDSYVGRFRVFYAFYVVGCFRPIANFLITSSGITVVQKLWLLKAIGFANMAMAFIEPIRIVLIFEQLDLPRNIDQVRRYTSLFLVTQTLGILFSWFALGGKQPKETTHHSRSLNMFSVILIFFYVLYIVCFISIKHLLRPERIEPRIVHKVISCVVLGIWRSVKALYRRKSELPRAKHWLDRMENDYDARYIYQAKLLIEILTFYIPLLSGFTAWNFMTILMAEQSRRMTYTSMILSVTSFFHIFKILIVLLFEFVVVRVLRKYAISLTPLKCMGFGHFFTTLALTASLVAHLFLNTDSIAPSPGYGQVRFYNAHVGVVAFRSNLCSNSWNLISPGSAFIVARTPVKGERHEMARVKFTTNANEVETKERILVVEGQSISYLMTKRSLIRVLGFDPILKGPPGMNHPDYPRVTILCGLQFCFGNAIFRNNETSYRFGLPVTNDMRGVFTVAANRYNLWIQQGELFVSISKNVEFKIGGTYCLLIYPLKNIMGGSIFTLWSPAVLPQAILLIPIFLFAIGSTLLFISMLHFLYTQSPSHLVCFTFSLFYTHDGLGLLIMYIQKTYWYSVITLSMIIVYAAAEAVMTIVHAYLASKFKGQVWTAEGAVYGDYSPHLTASSLQQSEINRRSTVSYSGS